MGIRPNASRLFNGIESLEDRNLMAADFVMAPLLPACNPLRPVEQVVVKQPAAMQVADHGAQFFANEPRVPAQLLGVPIRVATEDFVARYRNVPPGFGSLQPLHPAANPQQAVDEALAQMLELGSSVEAPKETPAEENASLK